jgi:hypothetical protein
MRQQLSHLQSEHDALQQAFGCSSFAELGQMFSSLESQLKDFYNRVAVPNPRPASTISVEDFLVRVGFSSLNEVLGMVESLRDQLQALYAEGENRAMEESLVQHYAEKNEFQERFGVCSVGECSTMLSSLDAQLRSFYSQLERIA